MNYYGLKALATWSGSAGAQSFPFIKRSNIGRVSIHGSTSADIDLYFDRMKNYSQLWVIYTHQIVAEPEPENTSIAEWNYFLSKVDTGVTEGWLELVSYKDLQQTLADYGIDDNDKSIQEAIIYELLLKIKGY